MATLTKDMVIKANSKMENGFKLDTHQYVLWNEKQAHKYIDLENNNKLEIEIEYNSTRTENNLVVSVTEWKPTSTGNGYFCDMHLKQRTISEGHEKKLFKLIQEETKNWPDKKCLELFEELKNETPDNMLNGFII